MSFNERLIELRKALDMTQIDFAKALDLSTSSVSQYEISRRTPSPSTVSTICYKWNVNRNWLETGEGEMFTKDTNSLDLLCAKNNLTREQRAIVEVYMSLDAPHRQNIINFIDDLSAELQKIRDEKDLAPSD